MPVLFSPDMVAIFFHEAVAFIVDVVEFVILNYEVGGVIVNIEVLFF